MSWHHGDWLAFAQAAAAVVAIFGAYGVVFLQQRHERKRAGESNARFKCGVLVLIDRTDSLLKEINSGALNRVSLTISPQDGIDRFKNAVITRTRFIQDVVDTLPIGQVAEAGCIDSVFYLRDALAELHDAGAKGTFGITGPSDYASPVHLTRASLFIKRAREECLGLPISVPDAAKGELRKVELRE